MFDEMRRVRVWRESGVVMDVMAAAELVSIAQMREYQALHSTWKRAGWVSRARRGGGVRRGDHRAAKRHSKDVGREDGFRRCGLEVFRVTGIDMPHPTLVMDRMAAARLRAKWNYDGSTR